MVSVHFHSLGNKPEENDLLNICASEGASSDAHSLKMQGAIIIVRPRGLVRLEFQKKASYFINTTIDIFESGNK